MFVEVMDFLCVISIHNVSFIKKRKCLKCIEQITSILRRNLGSRKFDLVKNISKFYFLDFVSLRKFYSNYWKRWSNFWKKRCPEKVEICKCLNPSRWVVAKSESISPSPNPRSKPESKSKPSKRKSKSPSLWSKSLS